MIRAITTAILLTLSGVAVGADQAVKDHCAKESEGAEYIMEQRQAGTPMREMMDRAGNPFTEKMVEHAYETFRWANEERQEAEVRRFGNAAYLACYWNETGEGPDE